MSQSILDRYHWWTSLKHGGLLIAPARLAEFFPEEPPQPLPRYLADRLRSDVIRVQDGDLDRLGPLLDTVLEETLELDRAWWLKGPALDARWSERAVTGELIKPRRVWRAEAITLPLFSTTAMPGGPISRLGVGRGRRAVSRVVEWLRKAGHKIALLTNGQQWRLIHAGADYNAWCEWDLDFWFEEGRPGPQLDALRLLLGRPALTAANGDAPPLLAAIQASRQGQAELSGVLGERVRQAVELVIRHSAQNVAELPQTVPQDIYIAATRIVMRCVIILFAEARQLLPTDNPIYHQSYGLQGLREQLERRAGGHPERLRHSFGAWPRLLALFRLVYYGSDHADLPIPRYGGDLFAPGRPQQAAHPVELALTAFERIDPCPSDAAVHRLLTLLTRSQVKIRQGRRSTWVEAPVDFSDLSSEYIGILYEGLLDFELRRAEEPMLFLNLGDQPALPLSRLEQMDAQALAALVERLGRPSRPLPPTGDETEESDEAEPAEEEPDEDEDETEETAPADRDEAEEIDDITQRVYDQAYRWARRAATEGGLVAKGTADYETEAHRAADRLLGRIILPGGWFLVRWGGTRKGSGSFYTRPQLAVPTTHRALEPLAYRVESSVRDDRAEPPAPRAPAEILSLKICDPAMGSGSFLIAALRYLTEALYESLHHHGHLEQHGQQTLCRLPDGRATNSFQVETLPMPLDQADFEERLKARLKRHLVERCLYGVDLNPMAVELARLALWVETMDRSLPFDFLEHKLKCGNALVGCWFDYFRDYPVMAWERDGGDQNHTRFVHHFREYTYRDKQRTKGDLWTRAITEAKNDEIKPGMVDWLQTTAGQIDFDDRLAGQTAAELHEQGRRALADIHQSPVEQPEQKAALYQERIRDNDHYNRLKRAFDTWCALWFWPGGELEEAPRPRTFYDPGPAAQVVVDRLAGEFRFFHWELEYPDVFNPDRSGFDAIIGNPPWDILKPNSMEFFSNIDPLYRTYGKQEALRYQEQYFEANPQIERDWLAYNARFRALSNWVKYVANPYGDGEDQFSFTRSRRENTELHTYWRRRRQQFDTYADPAHPFQHQGAADLNTYKLFLESGYSLLRRGGRLGLIVPSGLYTDKGTTELRTLFLENARWEWLFGFENRRKIFDIDSRFKFCPIIVEKGGQTRTIQAAFMQHAVENWTEAEKHALAYPAARVRQFSPNTQAILETRTAQDLDILARMYDHGIPLGDESEAGWGLQYAREFDMTNDSRLFPPRPQWEADGYRPDEYGHWLKGNWQPAGDSAPAAGVIFSPDGESRIAIPEVEDIALPLYEGRMIGQFDFSQKGWVSGKGRGAVWEEFSWDNKFIKPQFLMSRQNFIEAGTFRGIKAVFLAIGSATNARSMVSATLYEFPCGNSVPVLQSGEQEIDNLILPTILNSFVYDFSLRCRLGGINLNYFIVAETPILKHKIIMSEANLALLTACLNWAHQLFAEFWLRFILPSFPDLSEIYAWQQLWAITPHERLRLRCILDAVIAELYGLGADDLAWILRDCDHPVETMRSRDFYRTLDPKGFWRVDKEKVPELRHTVLAQVAFRDLKRRGLADFLAQNGGEGWQLPVSLRLADYGLGHDDRARQGQPVAARLGPRFLPWQLAQEPARSWAECERHAENLRLLLGGDPAPSAPSAPDPSTDLFGRPLQRDLFGNVVYPSGKRRRK